MNKKIIVLVVIILLMITIVAFIQHIHNRNADNIDIGESNSISFWRSQVGDMLDTQKILSYLDVIKLVDTVYSNNVLQNPEIGTLHIEFNYTEFDLLEENSVQKLKDRIYKTENYHIINFEFDNNGRLKKIILTNYYE